MDHKGKKRHLLVDTLELLLVALVHSSDFHDREGGLMLLARLAGRFPSLRKLSAHSAYRGPMFRHGIAVMLPQFAEVRALTLLCPRMGTHYGLRASISYRGHRPHGITP
jgi:hypothetical protein